MKFILDFLPRDFFLLKPNYKLNSESLAIDCMCYAKINVEFRHFLFLSQN